MKNKIFLTISFLIILLVPYKLVAQQDNSSNAIKSIDYSGIYEAHYTATIPVSIMETGCELDFGQGVKLYQYRYFTKIPLPKKAKKLGLFRKKYSEKTIQQSLKKYYKAQEERAWVVVRASFQEKFNRDYQNIKNCVTFENLDFRAVAIKNVFR